jgi:hypothetical protein
MSELVPNPDHWMSWLKREVQAQSCWARDQRPRSHTRTGTVRTDLNRTFGIQWHGNSFLSLTPTGVDSGAADSHGSTLVGDTRIGAPVRHHGHFSVQNGEETMAKGGWFTLPMTMAQKLPPPTRGDPRPKPTPTSNSKSSANQLCLVRSWTPSWGPGEARRVLFDAQTTMLKQNHCGGSISLLLCLNFLLDGVLNWGWFGYLGGMDEMDKRGKGGSYVWGRVRARAADLVGGSAFTWDIERSLVGGWSWQLGPPSNEGMGRAVSDRLVSGAELSGRAKPSWANKVKWAKAQACYFSFLSSFFSFPFFFFCKFLL